jgi:hypothetical protein
MGKISEKLKDNIAGVKSEPGGEKWLRAVFPVIALLIIINIALGIWWSQEPEIFVVQKMPNAKIGETTVSTLARVVETLTNKPGGYLSNDYMPPGIVLDNIPAWEFGVVVQVRDISRVLRKDISRSQSQSTEDASLALAEPRFNLTHTNFMLPAYEDYLQEGVEHLRNYEKRLADEDQYNAQFYARADNLNHWLTDVSTRLGSLSQQLSASVAEVRTNTDLAGDSAAKQSTYAPDSLNVQTPFLEIDDVFYEARGSCWALVHLLKAIEIDFNDILAKKNALASLRQIIRELESTQKTVWSPMILSGSGFGLWANHSLVMANYISRANAAIIDLKNLLEEG